MSLIVLCALKFITIVEGLVVLATALLLTIGIIFNGFNINVARPNIKSGDGDESQSNTLTAMLFGILITAVEGILAIFLSFFLSVEYTYLILLGIVLLYATINTVLFLTLTKKRYLKIEQ